MKETSEDPDMKSEAFTIKEEITFYRRNFKIVKCVILTIAFRQSWSAHNKVIAFSD